MVLVAKICLSVWRNLKLFCCNVAMYFGGRKIVGSETYRNREQGFMKKCRFLQRFWLNFLVCVVFSVVDGANKLGVLPQNVPIKQLISPQKLCETLEELEDSHPCIAENFGLPLNDVVMIMGYPLRRDDIKFSEVLMSQAQALSQSQNEDELFDFDVAEFEEQVNKYLAGYSNEAIKNIIELFSICGFRETQGSLRSGSIPKGFSGSDFSDLFRRALRLRNNQGMGFDILRYFNRSIPNSFGGSVDSDLFWETLRLADYLGATAVYKMLCEALADIYPEVYQNLTAIKNTTKRRNCCWIDRLPMLSHEAMQVLGRPFDEKDLGKQSIFVFFELLEESLKLPCLIDDESVTELARRLQDTLPLVSKIGLGDFFNVLHLASRYKARDLFDHMVQKRLVDRAFDSPTGMPSQNDANELGNYYANSEYYKYCATKDLNPPYLARRPKEFYVGKKRILAVYTNFKALLIERALLRLYNFAFINDLNIEAGRPLREQWRDVENLSHKDYAKALAFFRHYRKAHNERMRMLGPLYNDLAARRCGYIHDYCARELLSLNPNHLNLKIPSDFFHIMPLANIVSVAPNFPMDVSEVKLFESDETRSCIVPKQKLTWDDLERLLVYKSLKKLDLSGLELRGKIPSWLSELRYLEYLNLRGNKLKGLRPHLRDLAYLDLAYNNLLGSIPEALRGCKKLKYLDLSNNRLTGVIPDWLGELILLETLILADNYLTGSIPEPLGNCSDLGLLDLRCNFLDVVTTPDWINDTPEVVRSKKYFIDWQRRHNSSSSCVVS